MNSQQGSSELEDNKTNGISRQNHHWWNRKEPLAEGATKFTPPVTHDKVNPAQIKRKKGAKLKRKFLFFGAIVDIPKEDHEHAPIADPGRDLYK